MRGWIAGAALAISAFACLAYVRGAEPFGLDQGLFAVFGQFVPEGLLPYRDVWDSKPPAIFYTYAVARSVFGDGPAGVWRFEVAWLLLTAALVGGLARRLWGNAEALAAGILLLAGMWAPGWGGYASRAQAEEFCALWLLAGAWAGMAAARRPRAALACGALLGIAGLYKVPALALAGAWPVYWTVLGGRAAWRTSAWMVAGLILPWAATWSYFAAHGAASEFMDAVWTYGRAYAGLIAESTTWAQTLSGVATRTVRAVPVQVASAVVGLAVLARRRDRAWIWIAASLGLGLVAVVAQRQLAGYHFLLLVPVLAVAGARGVVAVLRGAVRGSMRRAWLGALLLLVGLASWNAPAWRRMHGWSWQYRLGNLERSRYLETFRTRTVSPAAEVEAARYVRETTRPGESILVWGLAPGIYALAQRRPATRYPFHHLLLTEAPLSLRYGDLAQRRAALVEDLRRDPPALILVGLDDRNPFEPRTSDDQLRRFSGLRDLARELYHQEPARVAGFAVLRRRVAGAASAGDAPESPGSSRRLGGAIAIHAAMAELRVAARARGACGQARQSGPSSREERNDAYVVLHGPGRLRSGADRL